MPSNIDNVSGIIDPAALADLQSALEVIQKIVPAVGSLIQVCNSVNDGFFRKPVENLNDYYENTTKAATATKELTTITNQYTNASNNATAANEKLNTGLDENIKQQVLLAEAIANQRGRIIVLNSQYEEYVQKGAKYKEATEAIKKSMNEASAELAKNVEQQKLLGTQFNSTISYMDKLVGANAKIAQSDTVTAKAAAVRTEELRRMNLSLKEAAEAELGYSNAQLTANALANKRTVTKILSEDIARDNKAKVESGKIDAQNIAFMRQLEVAERNEVIALNKHVDAVNKVNAKNQEAAGTFTFMGRSIAQIYSQIGRMIVSMTFFTVVIGAVMLVVEKLTSLYTDWRDGITAADKAMKDSLDTIDKKNQKLEDHNRLMEESNSLYKKAKDLKELGDIEDNAELEKLNSKLSALKSQEGFLERQLQNDKNRKASASDILNIEEKLKANRDLQEKTSKNIYDTTLSQIALSKDELVTKRDVEMPYGNSEIKKWDGVKAEIIKSIKTKEPYFTDTSDSRVEELMRGQGYDPKKDDRTKEGKINIEGNAHNIDVLNAKIAALDKAKQSAELKYGEAQFSKDEKENKLPKGRTPHDYEYDADKDLIKSKAALKEEEIKIEIEKNKAIIQDAIKSADERVRLVYDTANKEKEINEAEAVKQRDLENERYAHLLRQGKLNSEQKQKEAEANANNLKAIEERRLADDEKAQNAAQKQATEILKVEIEKRYGIIHEDIERRRKERQIDIDKETQDNENHSFGYHLLSAATNETASGALQEAKNSYTAKSHTLDNDQVANFDNLNADNAKLEQQKKDGISTLETEQNIENDKIKIHLTSAAKTQNAEELKQEQEKIFAAETVNLEKATADAIQTIRDNAYQQDILNLENKSKLTQLKTQEEINSVQASTGFQIQKQQQLNKINAEGQSQQNQIQAQIRSDEIKKAQFDKEAAESKIIANTAVAIVKVFADLGPEDPLAYVLAGIMAATGAAQLAAAASAPIPQYFMGIDNHPGGLAILGDGGEPERATLPSGKSFMSESKPTLYDLPAGTRVDPLHKLLHDVNMISPVGVPPIVIGGSHAMDTKVLERKLDAVIESNHDIAMAIIRKPNLTLKGVSKSKDEYYKIIFK